MAVIGYDAQLTSGDPQTHDELVVLPDGNYEFEVVKCEKTQKKSDPGLGDPCINALLRITADDGKQNLVYWWMKMDDADNYKKNIDAFAIAIGELAEGAPKGTPYSLDWNNLRGRTGMCSIYTDVYNDKKRNRIRSLFAKPSEEAMNKYGSL